jgi:hypothetical protein
MTIKKPTVKKNRRRPLLMKFGSKINGEIRVANRQFTVGRQRSIAFGAVCCRVRGP